MKVLRTVTAAVNTTDNILNKIKSEIEEHLKPTLYSLGFTDDDMDYCIVEVSKHNHTYARIEIRAEVDYEDLSAIGNAGDEYVSQYDQDAYFEPVDSGITECYINYRKVAAALGIRLH